MRCVGRNPLALQASASLVAHSTKKDAPFDTNPRSFSLSAVALVTGLMLAGPAAAQNIPIKFSLDWRFEGPAAPFFLAIDKGYYKAEGLNVTIDPGAGSVEASTASPPAPTRWASPTSTRWSSTATNPRNAGQGRDDGLRHPRVFHRRRKKNGIAKPKDLEGKMLGAPPPTAPTRSGRSSCRRTRSTRRK